LITAIEKVDREE